MGRGADRYEPVEIHDVTVKYETDGALLVVADGEEVWIPKSQIDDDSEVYAKGTSGTLIIPRWLAREKGLEED